MWKIGVHPNVLLSLLCPFILSCSLFFSEQILNEFFLVSPDVQVFISVVVNWCCSLGKKATECSAKQVCDVFLHNLLFFGLLAWFSSPLWVFQQTFKLFHWDYIIVSLFGGNLGWDFFNDGGSSKFTLGSLFMEQRQFILELQGWFEWSLTFDWFSFSLSLVLHHDNCHSGSVAHKTTTVVVVSLESLRIWFSPHRVMVQLNVAWNVVANRPKVRPKISFLPWLLREFVG